MERDRFFFVVQVIIIVSRALAVSSITFFTDIFLSCSVVMRLFSAPIHFGGANRASQQFNISLTFSLPVSGISVDGEV